MDLTAKVEAIEKRVAALEEKVARQPKGLKFNKEKFIATVKMNIPQYFKIDVSEGSTISSTTM